MSLSAARGTLWPPMVQRHRWAADGMVHDSAELVLTWVTAAQALLLCSFAAGPLLACRHLFGCWACLHFVQAVAEGVLVFLLAYATAYGETLTIAHFPYYSFKVRCVASLATIAAGRHWPRLLLGPSPR